MKAITLWQPWATLVAFGVKTSETRHWAFEHWREHSPVAIHAAKRPVRASEVRFVLDALGVVSGCDPDPDRQRRASAASQAILEDVVPYGALVATARLGRCSRVVSWETTGPRIPYRLRVLDDGSKVYDDNLGDYSVGRYVWRLLEIEALTDPVPYSGRQGFWHLPNEALG